MTKRQKIFIVMPARNNEKTIERTYRDVPHGLVNGIIVNDNASKDKTIAVARKLGLKIIRQKEDRGYGGAQKALYNEALKQNADIVIMLHPDYQYDPTKIPELIEPIVKGRHVVMLGSRMLHNNAIKGGMPLWRYIGNKVLTKIENIVLGLNLSEYHTGLRAFSKKFLKTVPYNLNSDDFVFDQELLIQAAAFNFKGKIGEIDIPTRYFKEASSIKFMPALKYGIGTMKTLLRFVLHKYGIKKCKQFGF